MSAGARDPRTCAELARLGSATVYEAAGREGLVDAEFHRLSPGARACGPARTALCGQDDNLMVHAAMSRLAPGEVLVLAMPEPAPVALIGDLLATQARVAGAVAVLCDGAARDTDELATIGIPVWSRYVRCRGATKEIVGALDVPVTVGGLQIAPADLVVLDGDGVTVVPAARAGEVLEASRARENKERVKRERLARGELSYEIDGLRDVVEGGG